MNDRDEAIRRAVLHELEWDTRVDHAKILVDVDMGVVTLSGNASSWASRIAAQEAAHRVAGVLDVANEIEVILARATERPDTAIAHAVRSALVWDVLVPDTRIHSTVSNGLVRLTGDVDYWTEREDAEHAVRNLAGVRQVVNEVQVRPAELAPHDIRKSIEAALTRRAEREANRVKLDVHGGRVTLSGTVNSWAERQAVLGAARSTPGVHAVEDHLTVEPFAA